MRHSESVGLGFFGLRIITFRVGGRQYTKYFVKVTGSSKTLQFLILSSVKEGALFGPQWLLLASRGASAFATPTTSSRALAGFRPSLAVLALLRFWFVHARPKWCSRFAWATFHQLLAHETGEQGVDLIIEIIKRIESGLLQKKPGIRVHF